MRKCINGALTLLFGKPSKSFCLTIDERAMELFSLSVSYSPLSYLMHAFSHQALNFSFACHIALHTCARYVILLGTKPNIKWLCSYRIPCFSVNGHIFVSLSSQNFKSNYFD